VALILKASYLALVLAFKMVVSNLFLVLP